MKQDKKTNITLVVFILVVSVFIILLIYPYLNKIKESSADLLAQKNSLALLETKAENLQQFQATYRTYEPNLEKIDMLFVHSAEPINFIEFLETQTLQSQLAIKISPFAPEEIKGDPWSSMNFRLNLIGPFPGFLNFFEKLESSPYLIEVLDLSIRRLHEWDIRNEQFETFSVGDVNTSLLIKTYIKED